MTYRSSNGAAAPNKPLSHCVPLNEVSPAHFGLVQHELLSGSLQVQILSLVDATGSASVGDIIAELPNHPEPVGAVLALVEAGVLVIETHGPLDAHSMVRRPNPPTDDVEQDPVEAAPSPDPLPPGIRALQVSPLTPSIHVCCGGAKRSFLRIPALAAVGIYILLSGTAAYIGYARNVGARIANGQQPIGNIDTIIAITDASGTLSDEDGRAGERILWSRVAACGDVRRLNDLPDGRVVDPARYDQIDIFIAQAVLVLRQDGWLFRHGSVRSVVAGPRAEPTRLGALRRLDEVPDGEILELSFGRGLTALAARQADDCWLLLRGSDVRLRTVASANASANFLRAAWLHAGLLKPAHDGRCYTVTRDLVFESGSAAAQFVSGSKGRTLAAWVPIDPAPDTAEILVP